MSVLGGRLAGAGTHANDLPLPLINGLAKQMDDLPTHRPIIYFRQFRELGMELFGHPHAYNHRLSHPPECTTDACHPCGSVVICSILSPSVVHKESIPQKQRISSHSGQPPANGRTYERTTYGVTTCP